MYEKTTKIWMDGKLIPWADATVHILTHSLHYGVGVFEGIRYYRGDQETAIFRLNDHTQRFCDSAKIVAMKLPYSAAELSQACIDTARMNGLKEGYIRPLAFISEGPNVGIWAYDNPVRVTIATYGWGAYLGKEGLTHGIRAKVSSYTRHHRNVGMTRGKITGQYFNSVLAKRESKLAGADEAILLDTEGYVAEGSGENIFLVRNGSVRTPCLGSILSGFTRDTLIRILRDEGTEVTECQITRDELYMADEVFFCGTAAEVTPIREVDGRPVGTGTPGPMTRKLQDTYADIVRGKNKKYRDWLTPINA